MPFAELPDAKIHYEIIGQGPPVLLVSGLAGVASYWRWNLDAITKHYTVILHDHRGTGSSSKSEMEYSVELLADDLMKLMDIIGIERASLIGHSTGGAIGQVIAAKAPARIDRMMLYASWAALCPQMHECLSMRQQLLRAGGTLAYHRASPVFLYPPQFMCDEWETIQAEIAAGNAATSPASILDARLDAIMKFDGMPYLPLITAPTTVLVAQDDILTPPLCSAVLHEGIRDAQLRVLPYGAHAVSRTDIPAFNQAMLAFLDGL